MGSLPAEVGRDAADERVVVLEPREVCAEAEQPAGEPQHLFIGCL